jgi:hypothetical protein
MSASSLLKTVMMAKYAHLIHATDPPEHAITKLFAQILLSSALSLPAATKPGATWMKLFHAPNHALMVLIARTTIHALQMNAKITSAAVHIKAVRSISAIL